ncbi:MAG: Hsp20/alpha crystallin family protein [Deltaproteobacteria bacterium]|nr:Hsp20/alpha crystallin family protein [Deltaproteobacteria bacterium]
MAIQRWDPLREFERLHDEMDRLFRTSTGRGGVPAPVSDTNVPVAVDILENVEEIVVKAELPGVKGENVSVKVEDNVLSITGERKFEHDERKDTCLRVERCYGTFSRSFSLPPYVDAGKILADYKDGVLTLHLPKRAETKPRQIQVKIG